MPTGIHFVDNSPVTPLSAAKLNELVAFVDQALLVPAEGLAARLADSQVTAALLAIVYANNPVALAPPPTGGDDMATLATFLSANAGKVCALRNGATYKLIAGALPVPSSTTLEMSNAKFDATAMAVGTALSQRFAVRSDGALGAQVAVSVAIAKWSKSITGVADTTGIEVGDTIIISSDDPVVPGMNLANRDKAEVNVVAAKTSTTLTLTHGAIFSYTTTGLTVRKMTPTTKVVIRNGSILMGGVGSAHNGVQFEYARDVAVTNVHVDGAEDVGFGFKTTLNGTLRDSSARNCTSQAPGPTGLGETGYGACVWDASRLVTIENNYFENNRHHVAGGGIWPASFVQVLNNKGRKSSSASYDCHEPCHYWTFKNNTAEVGSHGFFIRGQYTSVIDNHVSDISQEAYAVHCYNEVLEQYGTRLKGNTATHCGYGLSVGKASGETLEYLSRDLVVMNNDFTDCGTNPFRIRYFDTAKVSGNTVNGGLVAGMLLEGVDATYRSKNLTLDMNDVKAAGTHGVHLKYVDDVKGVGGFIQAPGQNGYFVEQCNRVDIGPKVLNPAQVGIQFTGGTGHILNGANVSGGTNGAYDAVRSADVGTLNVIGGYLASARYAIYNSTATTSKLNVVGTQVSGTVHATKVNVDAGTTYTYAGLF